MPKVIEAYEAIRPGTTVVLHAPKGRFAMVHSRTPDGTLLVRPLIYGFGTGMYDGYSKIVSMLPNHYHYSLQEEEAFTTWWTSQCLSGEIRHVALLAWNAAKEEGRQL